jgi:predicted HAD superfamily Cof-like phosphohydrolase
MVWRGEEVGWILAAMLLKEVLSSVAEFHTAFRIPNADAPHATLPREEALLRHRLMAEENDEYLEAAENGDVVEVADALGDQLYILAGTMMRHGMQDVIAKVFREIQASNMSKLGANGEPILREDGKVMKGPNFFRPNIAGILDADASARSKAPSQMQVDKLAWSVNNEPAPLDRLSHAEMVSDTLEVAEEVNLMV